MIDTNEDKINNILENGTEDIFVKESLVKKLKSGKKLRIKLGVDPTSPNVHLGRAIPIRKLRDFQKLGHKVIFIAGDFTAQVGDPSDKLEKRPMLDEAKIKENLKSYKKQVGKIIDLKKADFVYNSKWLSKLSFKEVARLAESFSVSQMSNRRNFKTRLENGDDVSLREFLYPLMQGYDSVVVKADIELGGFDQLFNVKAGRAVQKHFGQEEQDVLTTEMLEGTDGRKMSSSWGNVISLNDEAGDMYGKIMAIQDELISKYFRLCTDLSNTELEEMKQVSESDPKKAKMKLAREIVTLYHSVVDAENAEKNWEETFSKKGIPENVDSISVEVDKILIDILVENNIVDSKTEARRLFESGAIKDAETQNKLSDINFIPRNNQVIKVGKKRFVKIIK